MKKLLLLLFIFPFMCACGDDDTKTTKQEYTSFQVKSEEKEGTYRNVVAGYRLPNDTLVHIADLGDISTNEYSKKIILDFNAIKEVEIFFDAYKYDGTFGNTYNIATISIKENENNIYIIPNNAIGGKKVNKLEPTEYPIKK